MVGDPTVRIMHDLDSDHETDFLCPRESLQATLSIIVQNVKGVTESLSRHSDLYSKTVVYPSTNFPGRTQEGLLGQLLRKKLEPQVETWVEEGRAAEITNDTEKVEDLDELWAWAKGYTGERVARYALEEAGENYSAEERELGIGNVRTGLRRPLEVDDAEDSGDEDEDEDEDEEMEMDIGATVGSNGLEEAKIIPEGKVRTMDDILRFATSGASVGGRSSR